MQVISASIAHFPEAQSLLHEYYEAVSVQMRDAPEDIAAWLSGGVSGFWIAYVEATPAGCVALRPLRHLDRAGECKRLYVRPRFRRRGVAEALLDAMEKYAADLCLKWIYLDSKDDLRDALRIYERRDYRACERFNDNPQATIFLRKHLRRTPGGAS